MSKRTILTCEFMNAHLTVEQLVEVFNSRVPRETAVLLEVTADTPDEQSVDSFKVGIDYTDAKDLVQKSFSLAGTLTYANADEYDCEGEYEVADMVEDLFPEKPMPEEPVIIYTDVQEDD